MKKNNLNDVSNKKEKKYQSEYNSPKINNIYKNSFYIFLFLFISIYIPAFRSKETKLRKIDTTTEIIITISGLGTQKILSDSYSTPFPDDVLINGNPTSNGNSVSDSNQEPNNIILKWNSDITDCK